VLSITSGSTNIVATANVANQSDQTSTLNALRSSVNSGGSIASINVISSAFTGSYTEPTTAASSSISIGMIVGIIIPIVIVLAIVVGIIFYRKNRAYR
jgi:hypothetical protein